MNPYTIVVWGDSIAASGWPSIAEQSFNVALNQGRPAKFINKGVGGMPASRARTQFDEAIASHKPDLVVIQFGFNDMRFDGSRGPLPLSTPDEFAGHLKDMASRCLALPAKVLLVGNHRTRRPQIMPPGLTYDQTRAQYSLVTRSVADQLRTDYVDMAEAMRLPDAPWHDLTNEDGVHLSETGKHHYGAIIASRCAEILRRG